MKHMIMLIGAVISLQACATSQPAPPPIEKPAPTPEPAPPPPAVDCTGLSDAECQHQIKHYGNPNPPPMRGPLDIDPVPVEPVDVEPMGEIITPNG